MNKKKAIIYTILLTVILFTVLIGTNFIRNANGESLFDIITKIMAGCWFGECINDFYNWLMKR